jgi:uncharacterized protein
MTSSSIRVAHSRLRSWFQQKGSVVVALSGGVDSSVLAYVANETLGENSLSLTAVSPSLARSELKGVREFVARHSIRFLEVATAELADERYVRNGSDRCFVCKSHLFEALVPIARERRAVMVLGTVTDDLLDVRPGRAAAAHYGAQEPYLECGLSKGHVRALASLLGLSEVADKPAAACLASRIPTGTRVTVGRLGMVERLESYLHEKGFRSVRVRYHETIARLEVPEEEMTNIVAGREQILKEAQRIGFERCVLDLMELHGGAREVLLASPLHIDPAS